MSDQLRSIYARWQNLEADKAAISEDLKELFAEAKSNGYDGKALRIAFRLKAQSEGPKAAEVAEVASLVEVYIAALSGTQIATHAHPRIAHEQSLVRDPPPGMTSTPAPEAKEAPAPIQRLDGTGGVRPRVSAAAPPGSATKKSPATVSDDDMRIPPFLVRGGV